MTLNDIAIVCGLCASLGTGAKYYADHEYVTVGALLKKEARELQHEIRELEYDDEHGGLTPKQQWQLEQLYKDLQEIEAELE